METRMELAEAIERLEAMPEFLEAALDVVTSEQARRRPAPGEFSLVEHACHLRDLEREAYLVRVRRMTLEQGPALEPYDGTKVAEGRDYLAQDALIAAQEFAAARRELTGMLAVVTAEDLRREATFGGRRVSFGEVIGMMVEHDRDHREQIERLMDAIDTGSA